jgi:hypothetical protein
MPLTAASFCSRQPPGEFDAGEVVGVSELELLEPKTHELARIRGATSSKRNARPIPGGAIGAAS